MAAAVAPFLSTLASDARPEIRPELEDPANASSYVTLIDPDYPLLPASPKVRGKLTVHGGTDTERYYDPDAPISDEDNC